MNNDELQVLGTENKKQNSWKWIDSCLLCGTLYSLLSYIQ